VRRGESGLVADAGAPPQRGRVRRGASPPRPTPPLPATPRAAGSEGGLAAPRAVLRAFVPLATEALPVNIIRHRASDPNKPVKVRPSGGGGGVGRWGGAGRGAGRRVAVQKPRRALHPREPPPTPTAPARRASPPPARSSTPRARRRRWGRSCRWTPRARPTLRPPPTTTPTRTAASTAPCCCSAELPAPGRGADTAPRCYSAEPVSSPARRRARRAARGPLPRRTRLGGTGATPRLGPKLAVRPW
jgi:hypothetical protein